MNNLKYVRFKRDIIIFPAYIDHNKMANQLIGIYNKEDLVSAGFISLKRECHPQFKNPGFYCYGKSVSLNLESKPEDSEILNVQQYGSMYEYPN